VLVDSFSDNYLDFHPGGKSVVLDSKQNPMLTKSQGAFVYRGNSNDRNQNHVEENRKSKFNSVGNESFYSIFDEKDNSQMTPLRVLKTHYKKFRILGTGTVTAKNYCFKKLQTKG